MILSMHPPENHRCQIYGNNSVRCVNHGTHWVTWGRFITSSTDSSAATDQGDFYSWECDGPHLYGEADTAFLSAKQEAA